MQTLKEEIRKRIKNAARIKFLEKGFSNAPMRDIAKKAKVSTSNLYTYFPSKENLFHALTYPTFQKINKLQKNFIETEKAIGKEQFFDQVSKFVAEPIGDLIKNNRVGFLLLIDKSQGTKYETFKDDLIKAIEGHFLEHIQSEKDISKEDMKDISVIHIIATNFLEGLLELARHYKSDEWIDSSIKSLMNYHINGIKAFF